MRREPLPPADGRAPARFTAQIGPELLTLNTRLPLNFKETSMQREPLNRRTVAARPPAQGTAQMRRLKHRRADLAAQMQVIKRLAVEEILAAMRRQAL